jgi:alkanesulfonate monooxygenase SsuD/methylene tetrahydromethanopterin reductase-like flavin-dependent oxidoreductase (luciferase family)
MKLGIVMMARPLPPNAGTSVIDRVLTFGQKTENLGFHGLWVPDAFGRGRASADPLLLLGALCAVTKRIELGTCVVQIPLRNPVEHAHRVQTLNLLSNRRLQFGVGSGSTRADFDAIGADYDARFKTLTSYLDVMRRTWQGEAVMGPGLITWPGTEGGPPVILGAWRSPRWINLAAKDLQGWMASGIFSEPEDVEIGVRMYREAGGKRIILANVFTDLRPEPIFADRLGHVKIDLICPPAEARDRLKRLEQLGIDDVLLACPFEDPDQLEMIRALAP